MGLCDGFMYVMLDWMYLQIKAIYNKTINKINVFDVSLFVWIPKCGFIFHNFNNCGNYIIYILLLKYGTKCYTNSEFPIVSS